jgi:hypothetical protein
MANYVSQSIVSSRASLLVLIGHPFTESYARREVPQSVWKSAPFRAINRQMSLVWGAAFFVGTISLIIAGPLDGMQPPLHT